jgi:hypothetical protein
MATVISEEKAIIDNLEKISDDSMKNFTELSTEK